MAPSDCWFSPPIYLASTGFCVIEWRELWNMYDYEFFFHHFWPPLFVCVASGYVTQYCCHLIDFRVSRSVANEIKVEIILSTSARCHFRVARHAIGSTLKLGATPRCQHRLVSPLIMFKPLHDSVSRFIVSAAINHSDDSVCICVLFLSSVFTGHDNLH